MAPVDAKAAKEALRARCRARRRNLDGRRRLPFDQRIRFHLLQALERLDARSLAAFLGFDGEPELRPALHDFAASGGAVALPMLIEERPAHIELRRWNAETRMRCNRFGIEEPLCTPRVSPADFDAIVLPLVAFDDRGSRLGMGAGHYDRLLEAVAARRPPWRIGVAYSEQRCESIPVEPWDVPLHAVITEQGWFSFGAENGDNSGHPFESTSES